MDKREMIERALGRLSREFVWCRKAPTDAQLPFDELIDALAEQIVEKGTWYPEGRFVKDGAIYNWYKNPIRCTAIILPAPPEEGSLEEEDEDKG